MSETYNHTIVSDVKGRAAFAFTKFGVSVASLKVSLPFTQHIVTLGIQHLSMPYNEITREWDQIFSLDKCPFKNIDP